MEASMDFCFAFNSDKFSDKTLCILIHSDDHSPSSGSKSDPRLRDDDEQLQESHDDHTPTSGSEPLTSRKRLRDDEQFQNSQDFPELSAQHRKLACNSDKVSPEDSTLIREEKQDHEVTKIHHDTSLRKDIAVSNQPGNEASQKNESSLKMHHFQEKHVPVSSVILAANSQFFHTLFSNGMRESGQQHVTIHIRASEEAAFMELLKYMYTRSLSSSTPSALLDVMMIADKFAVTSCVNLCSQSLLNLPMTVESAVLYLDSASTGLVADSVGPLSDLANNFLVEHFKCMTKDEIWNELLQLPLVCIESVLSSDSLEIESEYKIYDFILRWAETHYSDQLAERRKILNMLVRRFLRFPFLSAEEMESVLTCSDIDPATLSELSIGALRYYKAHPPQEQAPDEFRTQRIYKQLHLKAVASEDSSHPQCVVYLDLKREVCKSVFPNGEIHSETYFVGELEFDISITCSVPQNGSSPCFGLSVGVFTRVSETGLPISLKIALWNEQLQDFVITCKASITLTNKHNAAVVNDLFKVPWTTFISEDSPLFVNDILRLSCTISISSVE